MVKFWPSRRPVKSCQAQSVTVRSIAATMPIRTNVPEPGRARSRPVKTYPRPAVTAEGSGVIPSFLSSFLPVQKLGKNLG